MAVPSRPVSKRLLQELQNFERMANVRTVRLALSGRTYGLGGRFRSHLAVRTIKPADRPPSSSGPENAAADGQKGGEAARSEPDYDDPRFDPIERLGPVGDDLMHWEAVLQGIEDTAYAGGRWKLDIRIPNTYPIEPPKVVFMTKVCHPNVRFETGEICLDLLKTAWSPVYTIATTVMEIQQLLLVPVPDSPLNVDIAKLMRDGDEIAALGLIRYYTRTQVYEGK